MRAQYEADAARMSDMARTQVVVALKQLEEASHVLHIYEERLLPIARQQVDAARAAFIVVAGALRLRDRRGEEPARRRARSAGGASRLRPAARRARSRTRTHARPRWKGGRPMSDGTSKAARSRLVSIALVVSLAVLALVFHRQLIAWFSGASMAGSAGSSVTVHASGLSLSASLDPDPPRTQGQCARHPSAGRRRKARRRRSHRGLVRHARHGRDGRDEGRLPRGP